MGGQAEVDLRSLDAAMAQVRGQQWQLGAEVCAFAIPALKPMHSEGVAEVVHPRSTAATSMRDTALPQQVAEDLVHAAVAVGLSVGAGEEGRLRWPRTYAIRVATKSCLHGLGQRYQPVLLKLAVENRQNTLLEFDVADPEMTHFAVPQAAAAQKTEELGYHKVAQWGQRADRQAIGRG